MNRSLRTVVPGAITAAWLFGALSMALAAGTGSNPLVWLSTHDSYIAQGAIRAGKAAPGDVQRLDQQARNAASQGVPEKLALINKFPIRDGQDPYLAARDLRNSLGFSGVLVLVSPWGIGVSSDRLSLSEIQSIEYKTKAQCITVPVACAIHAGRLVVSQIKADQASSTRHSAIIWLVVLAVLALVILGLVWAAMRRRGAARSRLSDLGRAASNTLAQADTAIEQIESSGQQMAPDLRLEYDRALAQREQARSELERGRTPEMLTQANQDAAQAVLALQGIMRRLGIESPLANPLEAPGRRCFYCGHDDRPPYQKRIIEDGRGNSMEVDVCAVCSQQLAQGRTPQLATVSYGGAPVPWWAVPGNPYYYSYGGPTWQYWLPFLIGMDVGSWFGGGWGGEWDGDADRQGDAVPAGDLSGSTVDPYTDQGAGDYGAWAGDTGWSGGSAGDSGWSGDSGWGGDTGGDSGSAGDSGWGGDSGGDWGGGGDSGGGSW